ncbi:hypothetical protein B0T16DRAFT_389762 [Cercophora newfieldiana]|uniref:Uncharacterized protein n=1 Tax=Cercophora newfieldiana TaxID=92897 RepID=A0AA40CSM4_9PEZI|nr:hypothetical protein B0T16DRAFT_389762 [Cercophora newfieldiana]
MLAAPLALFAFAASALAATPTPPPLTYLYSVNLTFGDPILIGQVPYGKRDLLTISGGSFSGPKLTGKVVGGLDWGLTDSKGVFSPDAIYVLQTNDNATIAVFEKGYAPNVHILFETSSPKYAWLNPVVAYAGGGPFEGGVALDVWQIGA